MLLLVLILVLLAFALLVVALLTETALWAWVSVAVSVVAGIVLVIDWTRRRAAARREPDRLAPQRPAMPIPQRVPDDPATELIPIVTDQPARFGVEETIVMRPTEVSAPPPGTPTPVTQSGDRLSPNVIGDSPAASNGVRASTDAEPAADRAPRPDAQPAAPRLPVAPEPRRTSPEEPAVPDRPEPQPADQTEAAADAAPSADVDAAAKLDVIEEPDGGEKPEPAVEATDQPAVEPAASALPKSDTPDQASSTDPGDDAADPPADAPAEAPDIASAAASTADKSTTGSSTATADEPHSPAAAAAEREQAETVAAQLTTGGANRGTDTAGAASDGSAAQTPPSKYIDTDDRTMVMPATRNAEPPEEPRDPSNAAVVAELADEVAVIDERPRYHLTSCRFLSGKELIPLPVREAVELGFTPCGWCNPDRTLSNQHRATSSS